METVVGAIDTALRRQRWKLPQLAEELGIAPSTLRRYYNKERTPDIDLVVRVFALAGISMDSAFGMGGAVPVIEDEGLTARLGLVELQVQQLSNQVDALKVLLSSGASPATAKDFRGGLSDIAHAAAAQPRQDPAGATRAAAKPAATRRKRTG